MLPTTVILLLMLIKGHNVACGFMLFKYARQVDTSQYFAQQSPCPSVFQYQNDENGNLVGAVRVDQTDPDGRVQLDIELSVGNSVQGYNGKIILAEDRHKVIEDIVNGKPILYRVLFPAWQNIPPKVTKISVNGNLICSGPRIPIQMVPVLTTINLQHKLSLGLTPLSSSSDPSTDDSSTFDNIAAVIVTQVSDNNPFFNRRTESPLVVIQSTTKTPPRGGTSDGVIKGNLNEICGRPLPTNSLVVNGQSVPRGAYPWLVAIFRQLENLSLSYVCSGSLISERHVVTAAHCVKSEYKRVKPSEIVCVFGKLNIRKWVTAPGERMLEPDSIVIHPDYEPGKANADIAVMTFPDPIPFSKMIMPVCLWQGNSDLNQVVGNIGTVVGWGRDENGDVSTAEPRLVNMPIVDQLECLKGSTSTAGQALVEIVSKNTFCAGFRNGSGPCNGDSGSGFLLRKSGVFYLRGIVSTALSEATYRSCNLQEYVVFTDASKYLDWLMRILKQS